MPAMKKMAVNGETRLEVRHRPSGENSRFGGEELTFDEYVRRTTAMLRRVHAGCAEAEKIVAGNAPFELLPAGDNCRGRNKPYRRGVLLTHGLTDSPYFMRPLAEFYVQNGFRVMAILLPGHGTRPGDLLDVHWQEWVKTVAYGVDRLAEEADEVYLAGFSAGGALSVFQCLRDSRVHGLFLFSPALEISARARWANFHKLYSWLLPEAAWVDIKPDTNRYKYESFPKHAAAQMYALTQEVKSLLREHEIAKPVFAVASQDDITANPQATLEFMAHAPHPACRLVLYTSDTGNLPHGISAEKLEVVNSAFPERGILSSAHTAIVLPPEDAYYGEGGTYVNCGHYYPGDIQKYLACRNGCDGVLQGEITEANLEVGILRRLMYNPNFAALKVSMKRFFDDLPI